MDDTATCDHIEDKLNKLEHLSKILRAVRNVNQLITKETDRHRLLTRACELLVETRGYHNAWISLVDKDGKAVEPFYHAGFNGGFAPMAKALLAGDIPECVEVVMAHPGIAIVNDPLNHCSGCNLSGQYQGRAGMAMRLETRGRLFGWLCVSTPSEFAESEEEQELFEEVGGDISFALWSLEADSERQLLMDKYEAVLATTTNGVLSLTPDGVITLFNPGAEKIFGFTAEEAIGKHVSIFAPPDRVKEQAEKVRLVYELGALQAYETVRMAKDGRRIPIEVTMDLRKDQSGQAIGLTAIVRDITDRKQAEEALADSEEKYRALYENAPLAYQSLDDDGNFIDVNPAWLSTLGYNRDEVIGKPYPDFLHPDWKSHFIKYFPTFKENGVISGVEFKLRHKEGHYLDVSFEGCIGYNPDGSFRQTYCVFKDITEQKKAENALIESEKRLKALSEASFEAIFLSKDGVCIDQNLTAEKMFGYTREEGIGRHGLTGIIPEDRETVKEKMLQDYAAPYEVTALRKDGTTFPCEIQSRSIELYGEKIRIAAIRDITEKKKTQRALEETTAILQVAMDCSTAGIAIADAPSGKLRYVNDAGLAIRKGSPEEIVNGVDINKYVETWQILDFDGTPLEPEEVPLARAIIYGERCDRQFIIRRPGEDDRIVWATAAPIRNDQGEVVAGIVVFPDITELNQTEVALKKSEKKFRDIFESISDPVYIHDLGGKFIEVNKAASEALGYTRDELLQMTPLDLNATLKKKEEVVEKVRIIQQKGNLVFESTHFRKDGGIIPVEINSQAIEFDGKECILSVVRDISERKAAEKERTERNKFIETVLGNLPIGIAVNTIDEGKVFYANRMFEQIYGWTKEEVASVEFFFEKVFPDPDHRKEMLRLYVERVSTGDPDHMVWDNIEATGRDGKKRIVFAKSIPIYDQNLMISTAQDITEAKRLQSHLQQAQKMEAIGSLAGGIAHDFNNILFPIIGLSEMLIEDLPEESFENKHARAIHDAGKRGGELVQQILAFSRQTEQKMLPIKPQKILREVIKLCRAAIPTDIDIIQKIHKDCGMVMANPTQIHQVAMNLITNAYHAIDPNAGRISVTLGEVHIKEGEAKADFLKKGGYAWLSVSDTGCGVDPEILDKIFDPYFTTKPQGKGTGLGLAVVYGIVREHGGNIDVESLPGEGTTFNVYLPLHNDPNANEVSVGAKQHKTGTERILLVDDEAPIANLEKTMLGRLGYDVTIRTSSIEALEAFKNAPNDFDLVLTDMTMPNMTGDLLALEMIKIRPDIPIIIVTGFSERINAEIAREAGVKGFLMKPLVKHDLSVMVRNVLDEAQQK
jgi:PAS domain S-box-containing protein